MPHKHKRDKAKNGPSYDLPPSSLAHPLPVNKASPLAFTSALKPSEPRLRKRKFKSAAADDTPRAFARLMTYTLTGRKLPSGLDDGIRPSQKQKRATTSNNPPTSADPAPTTSTAPTLPKIQPHEPLSSFSARVDAALPVSGLAKKGNVRIEGEKVRQTKMEKRMQKMQREWREEERRIREKREEESDEGFDGEGDETAEVVKRGKKSKKRKCGTEAEDNDDDWAAITSKRTLPATAIAAAPAGKGGLVGLHDVVLAPPKLPKVREKFKEPGSTGTQGVVGGLKRQGELGEARMRVVEGYRALMRERKGGKGIEVS